MYADKITKSIAKTLEETERRREIQQAYNEKHGIVPKTIRKEVLEIIEATVADSKVPKHGRKKQETVAADVTKKTIAELTMEMKKAAELLQFELAAQLRDEIRKLGGDI